MLDSTFFDLPSRAIPDLPEGAVGILGARHGTPYAGSPERSAAVPDLLRAASEKQVWMKGHADFDTGESFPRGSEDSDHPGIFDCGDVETKADGGAANRRHISAATRDILRACARPVVVGGDDSVTIPFLAAFKAHEPVNLVQIDAHLDWCRERHGETMGRSSAMRCAGSMPWIRDIVQIGLRGTGSSDPEDRDDALRRGAGIITMNDMLEGGIETTVARIARDLPVVVALDCDGIDPSEIPGVQSPVPGGLRVAEVVFLLRRIATGPGIAGACLVELAPEPDDEKTLPAALALLRNLIAV